MKWEAGRDQRFPQLLSITTTSFIEKESSEMLLQKLYRVYRFIISLLRLFLIFIFMSLKGRLKKPGFRFSFISVFFYLTYDFVRMLFSRSDYYNDGIYDEVYPEDTTTDKDELIHPFKINISPEVLADLNLRLQRTRFEDSSEDGSEFDTNYLRTLIEYWRYQYKWRLREQEINKYPNFKTNIEGLDVHFIHAKSNVRTGKDLQVLPVLLIHGWPGSFYDYHKVIPLLINPQTDHKYVFDVVCPSVPGFGFSESPHMEGFNARNVSRIFLILMERLGYSKFYVQGCDWGCIIASLMARYHPHKILGLHVNMCFSTVKTIDYTVKLMLKTLFPMFTSEQEKKMICAFNKKLQTLLEESGYFYSRPMNADVIGCAMADSPSGMLAYILEKSSFATHSENSESSERDPKEELHLVDELLTTATIIWVNNNFAASSRFYKENIVEVLQWTHDKKPLTVPSAVAAFPDKSFMLSRSMMEDLFTDLVSYTAMPRGGHFCAAEEPELLADDVWNFVTMVQSRPWGQT